MDKCLFNCHLKNHELILITLEKKKWYFIILSKLKGYLTNRIKIK